ncbi:hypothetical protein AUT07_00473 [Candidatus Arsenophonus lipoptenae]|uniref:UPF0250 protein AUT07_00473 n=1 Tax=Candidatus Arsenophonus lipoptenae TaxID=634113 RepID=A0A109Q8V2_9GAMM|nr:DUF493 family protein YbeD [Candidatus Arsenophonus lipoptenae]AMA65040.1 hypothetical protein AUT07_00473 [Candidatus Arsenophonus lipoptenae]
MKTKLHELLQFPCLFTYKIIGIANIKLHEQIIQIIQTYISNEYTSSIKSSKKNNFYSVSITITAINIQQIEILYEEFAKLELVRIVL